MQNSIFNVFPCITIVCIDLQMTRTRESLLNQIKRVRSDHQVDSAGQRSKLCNQIPPNSFKGFIQSIHNKKNLGECLNFLLQCVRQVRKLWTPWSVVSKFLVEGFDVFGSHRLILRLDDLLQYTGEKFGNRLRGLFLIVAEDTCYRDILPLEERLEIVYRHRREDRLSSTRHSGTPQNLRFRRKPFLKWLRFEQPLSSAIRPLFKDVALLLLEIEATQPIGNGQTLIACIVVSYVIDVVRLITLGIVERAIVGNNIRGILEERH